MKDSRSKEIRNLVESAAKNEMYALGADQVATWLKKAAYERFKIDPASLTVVPWPGDGSDFNIKTTLTKEQYTELSEIITRTYPLYVVKFEDGVIKFYSGRTVGTQPEETV